MLQWIRLAPVFNPQHHAFEVGASHNVVCIWRLNVVRRDPAGHPIFYRHHSSRVIKPVSLVDIRAARTRPYGFVIPIRIRAERRERNAQQHEH